MFRNRVLCCAVLSHFGRVLLFVTLWTVACHTPLSMGFCRQEDWSGSPCPTPWDFPDPPLLCSPALAGRFLTTCATWKALRNPSNRNSQGNDVKKLLELSSLAGQRIWGQHTSISLFPYTGYKKELIVLLYSFCSSSANIHSILWG